MNIVIVENNVYAAEPYGIIFQKFGTITKPETVFIDPETVDLIVFTGGEDVDPEIYEEKRHKKTFCNLSRDLDEQLYFNVAIDKQIPMFGICRGAQFLCVMSGGKLVQHITGHQQSHFIENSEGETCYVTSSHHQMMLPPEDAKAFAWASPKLSDCYEGANGSLSVEREYEGVYFPNTKSLGVQWHPEWMTSGADGFEYTMTLIAKLLYGFS